MVLALEVRPLIKYRWSLSWEYFKSIHGLTVFLWFLAIFYIPITSPSPIPYAASYHILKCLPVGFFPLILAQTYCRNFKSFYGALFPQFYGVHKTINLYYPYFGVCLLAASVTGGNTVLFLTLAAGLMAGFLGTLRSQRFSPKTFYGLLALALLVTFLSTNQFYWLQANVKLDGSALVRNLVQNITALAFKQNQGDSFKPDTSQTGEQRTETITATVPQSNTLPPQTTEISKSPGSAETVPQPAENSESTENNEAPQNNVPAPSLPQSSVSSESSQGSDPPQGNGSSQNVAQSSQSTNNADSSQEARQPDGEGGNTPATNASQEASQVSDQGGDDGSQQNPSQPSPDINVNANATLNGSNPIQAASSLTQSAGGVIDPQNSLTQIGKSGSIELSDAVLFRVTPNPDQRSYKRAATFPLYIRETTYNQYSAGAWKAVNPEFVSQASQSNKRRWIFGSQTSGTMSVGISTRLPSREAILKLPVGTSEIDHLPVDSMRVSQYGTVAVQGKPEEITYTVQFDPTHAFESPPTAQEMDIPQAEQPAMQQILNSLNLRGKSPREKVQRISAFFQQGFQYSLDLHQPPQNTTPLSAFLLDHQSGHCEYFASATSLLLRAAGIPTRYAVGYIAQEYNPATQQYIVRARNAHAWVMAYVDGSWQTVETTPGNGLRQSGSSSTSPSEGALPETGAIATVMNEAPSQDKQVRPNPPQDRKNTVKKTKPFSEHITDTLKEIKSLPKKVSKAGTGIFQQLTQRLDSAVWPGAIIAVGLAILLCSLFFVWRVIRRKRSRHAKWLRGSGAFLAAQPVVDGLDSEFYLIEKRLGEWGLARQSSETVRQWIVRLKQKLPEAQMNHLDQIIDLHYRYRFDPQGIVQEDRAKLRSMIQTWLAAGRQ
jgi:transglutaminase-like putative cysteine protease